MRDSASQTVEKRRTMNDCGQPIIGVIGGAGVAAGARLVAQLEERVTAMGGFRDVHHPELIFWQATSAPSRSMFLEGRGPDFTPVYVNIGRQLKASGADVFCMACNAAHCRAEQIEQAVGLPLIHLLEKLFAAIRESYPQVKKVGILSSTGLRGDRIFYDHAAGLELLFANDEIQKMITAGICGIKNRNRSLPETDPARPRIQFLEACRNLIMGGAQVLALACSDIGVDFPFDEIDGIPVVDSMKVLTDAILHHWLKHGEFDFKHPLFVAAQEAKGSK